MNAGEFPGGSYVVSCEDGLLSIAMSGEASPDAFDTAYRAARGVDPDLEARATLMDVRDLDGHQFSVADVHKMIVSVRTHLPRGPEHRYAVVVSAAFMHSVGDLFLNAREVLNPAPATLRATTETFTDVDEAVRWLTTADLTAED